MKQLSPEEDLTTDREEGSQAHVSVACSPPDWFDDNSKPCPGQAIVRYGGVVVETEQGSERSYLSRCSHCNKPLSPALPSEPHTFIPCAPAAELSFVVSKVLIGVENAIADPSETICTWPIDGCAPGKQALSCNRTDCPQCRRRTSGVAEGSSGASP
jgi:hypothetical protein